jgi:hypothetical protein
MKQLNPIFGAATIAMVYLACADSATPAKRVPNDESSLNSCIKPSASSTTALMLAGSKDYVVDAKPILDANCVAGCHDTGGTGATAGILSNYAGVKAFDGTILKNSYQTGATNIMPKGKAELSLVQKTILDDFVASGRIEDKTKVSQPAPATSNGDPAGKVTYVGLVSTLLKMDCIGCHDGTNTETPNLTTYEGAKKEGGNLSLSLQDTTIHKDLKIPRDVYVQILEQWQADGFIEGSTYDAAADNGTAKTGNDGAGTTSVSPSTTSSTDPCASTPLRSDGKKTNSSPG